MDGHEAEVFAAVKNTLGMDQARAFPASWRAACSHPGRTDMRRLPFLLVAVLALAVACVGDDGQATGDGGADGVDGGTPPDGRTCSGTDLQVGTGVRAFLAVSDGDTVYLYRGPQGGYMLYLSVRARGLDPSDVTVCYEETFRSDGRLLGEGCWRVKLTNDAGDGWRERVGIWGEIEPEFWDKAGSVRGEDVAVSVTATDRHGCQVTAGWWAHISEEPGR